MSWQADLIRGFLRGAKGLQKWVTYQQVVRFSRAAEVLNIMPPRVRREQFEVAGLPCEWLIPREAHPDRVIYYIHGGGFVMPLYQPLKTFAARLAKATGTRMLIVHYRLAPAHPFPAAVEDSAKVYRWLINEHGTAPAEVVFYGKSAGGNLVMATALALREAGEPLPAGLMPVCAVFDIEATDDSFWADTDAIYKPPFVKAQLEAYQGQADPHHPLLSPLYADLSGLPPIYMQVGGKEGLYSDSGRLMEKGQAAGHDIKMDVWPQMWHFWHMFAPFLPEANEALGKLTTATMGFWSD